MSREQTNNASEVRDRDNVGNVLIADNDTDAARVVLETLARKGIRGYLAKDQKSALEFLEKDTCDFAFISQSVPRHFCAQEADRTDSDVRQTPSDCPALHESSFELLDKIRVNWPELPVIMLGRAPLIDKTIVRDAQEAESELLLWASAAAVRAVRGGCADFVIKPLQPEKVDRILDTFLPGHNISTIASAQEDMQLLYQIVGRSPKLLQAIELARRIAPTSAPVLISGESGTGKELFSYLVHHKSRRAQGPYVKVNCAALSDSLLESELFGHEKGAFTGAYTQRRGRFEMARGGTLLLDEITETPAKFQAKLLRVLEQQNFERVGGNDNIKADVRIVSTTNKDLLAEVQQGRFRQDLYYRLSGVRLFIAPLRQRREDLPDLVWHFVNLYAREAQRRITRLDPVMMDIFANYHWPGNVRQLRNVVRTSLILGSGETLSLADVSWLFDELEPLAQQEPADLSARLSGNVTANEKLELRENQPAGSFSPNGPRLTGLGGVPLEQIERQAILDTLRQTAGNQTQAARVLGISDRTLRDKIRRYRSEGCLQSA